MKSKFQIKSFVLGALLGAVIVIGVAADKEGTHPTVWEYNIVTQDLGSDTGNDYFWAQALTKKSAEGWDIVSSHRVNETTVQMILKRPKK
jgi:hypothetical protein